jgi:hypothetical protein
VLVKKPVKAKACDELQKKTTESILVVAGSMCLPAGVFSLKQDEPWAGGSLP